MEFLSLWKYENKKKKQHKINVINYNDREGDDREAANGVHAHKRTISVIIREIHVHTSPFNQYSIK